MHINTINRIGSIYVIKNKINGKMYVGQTVDLKNRLHGHRQSKNSIIGKAIKKYGWNNFEVMSFDNYSHDVLDSLEQDFIRVLRTEAPNGYNIMKGGQKNRKYTSQSKETIEKRTSKLRGHIFTDEQKKHMAESKIGHIVSEATRNKLSISLKKRWDSMSDEEKAKRQIGSIVKQMMTTEEGRKIISEAHKGHKAWNKDIQLSEEHCKALSEAHKGIPNNQLGLKRSDESKKKMSEAAKHRKSKGGGNTCKKVMCLETGIVYNSIKEAEAFVGIHGICRCCKVTTATVKGFHWQYYEAVV